MPPIGRNKQIVLGHCCGPITLPESGSLLFPVHMVEAMLKVQVDPACAGQCLVQPESEHGSQSQKNFVFWLADVCKKSGWAGDDVVQLRST